MTIEDLLSELSDRGWYLYSMYNHPFDRPGPYQWETSIRKPGPPPLLAVGQGASLYDALSMAIDNIDRAEPYQMPTFTVTKEPVLSDILSKLTTPAEPFKRRAL